MRVLDYLRMSWAGIAGHKRRVGIVVVVIGVLFSVLIAACMLTNGVEKAVMAEQTAATNGKVVLLVEVDQGVCGEECDFEKSLETARRKIAEYGGEMLSATRYETGDGTFYSVPEGMLSEGLSEAEDDVPVVAASVRSIRYWQKKILSQGATAEQRLEAIKETYAEEGEVIESKRGIGMMAKVGAEYRIGGFLPSAMDRLSLSLSAVNDNHNPLNLILDNLAVGDSVSFVWNPNQEMKEKAVEMSSVGQGFAVFDEVEGALAYTKDAANVCSETLAMMKACPKAYQFRVSEVIGTPVSNAEAFKDIWKALRMITVLLSIVAIIVAVSTFLRLLGGEKRTIALYYALGASKVGVIGIYLVYFYLICVIAMMFALLLAGALVWAVNVISAESLMKVFALGFGRPEQRIVLTGWTNEIVVLLAVLRATAPISIILGFGAFSSKNIVRRMKK